jgi:hypothetical protein
MGKLTLRVSIIVTMSLTTLVHNKPVGTGVRLMARLQFIRMSGTDERTVRIATTSVLIQVMIQVLVTLFIGCGLPVLEVGGVAHRGLGRNG